MFVEVLVAGGGCPCLRVFTLVPRRSWVGRGRVVGGGEVCWLVGGGKVCWQLDSQGRPGGGRGRRGGRSSSPGRLSLPGRGAGAQSLEVGADAHDAVDAQPSGEYVGDYRTL